jgi:hypothetical protein
MSFTFFVKLYLAVITPILTSLAAILAVDHLHVASSIAIVTSVAISVTSIRFTLKFLYLIAEAKKATARKKYLVGDYNRLKILALANPAEAALFISTKRREAPRAQLAHT